MVSSSTIGRVRFSHAPFPRSLGKGGIRLTCRDIEILKAVSDYQVLATTQFYKLFFSSVSRARKRLRILTECGLLKRRLRAVAFGDGSAEAVYLPTNRGMRRLRSVDDSVVASCPRVGESADLFLNHTLARNDFRIGLVLSCRDRADVKPLTWQQGESIAMRASIVCGTVNPSMKSVSIIPDGMFDLESNGHKQRYYVEIDRGTASLSRIKAKFEAYASLANKLRSTHTTHAQSFRVLWVTQSRARCINIINAAAQCGRRYFCFQRFRFTTTNPRLSSQSGDISEPIWLSVEQSGRRYISLLDDLVAETSRFPIAAHSTDPTDP